MGLNTAVVFSVKHVPKWARPWEKGLYVVRFVIIRMRLRSDYMYAEPDVRQFAWSVL